MGKMTCHRSPKGLGRHGSFLLAVLFSGVIIARQHLAGGDMDVTSQAGKA